MNTAAAPGRRRLLGAGLAVGSFGAAAFAIGPDVSAAPAEVVALHPEMAAVLEPQARLARVYSGGRWCEGPVWSTARSALIFSDVRRNTIELLGPDGDAQTLRSPSNFANGNAVDSAGRLLSCEHLGRRVVRVEHDGRMSVLADRFEGGRLNSPNDLAVAADGSIWFTDPTFGITNPQEGRTAASEQRGRFVFRLGSDGQLRVAADSFEQPNGIVFSPDERTLYVSDASGGDGREGRREIRAFSVEGERLRGERVFARLETASPDGLEVDREGRLFAACRDGVHVWRADGTPLGRIATPAPCANLAFGGVDGRMLFACTGETIHRIATRTSGARRAG